MTKEDLKTIQRHSEIILNTLLDQEGISYDVASVEGPKFSVIENTSFNDWCDILLSTDSQASTEFDDPHSPLDYQMMIDALIAEGYIYSEKYNAILAPLFPN